MAKFQIEVSLDDLDSLRKVEKMQEAVEGLVDILPLNLDAEGLVYRKRILDSLGVFDVVRRLVNEILEGREGREGGF